jgi:hypothetical protein
MSYRYFISCEYNSTEKRASVIFNNSASEWQNIKTGLPQRSIQGPLLFHFIINDIVKMKFNVLLSY